MAFWNKKAVEGIAIPDLNLIWEKVDSSFVEAIAYDDENNELYVTLTHGSYVYQGVPKRIYEGMLDASSKGSYFNRNVKDTYVFTAR